MGLSLRRRTVDAEAVEVVRTPAQVAARTPAFALNRGPLGSSGPAAGAVAWQVLAGHRRAALTIPTVSSCRDLIVGAVVQMTLGRTRAGERIPAGTLLEQPDPDTTRAATLAGTVEDLIYDVRAYWLVLARDGIATERNPQGLPVRGRWIPVRDVDPQVSRDAGSYSRLEGYRIAGVRPLVAAENVIRFDSPLRGVLEKGADAIANALELEAAALRMSGVELPAGTLTNTGAELTRAEAEALIEWFEEARRNRTVAFLQNMEYERTQLSAEDLQLIEARANAATEMARLHNMPVTMVSASPSGSGSAMLYSNLGTQLSLMVSNAVAPYLAAIEQTLSLPAVTPQGQTVAFDRAAFLRSDPAEMRDHALELLAAKVISVDEARAMIGLGAPNGEAQ
jgi:hypothetical protein